MHSLARSMAPTNTTVLILLAIFATRNNNTTTFFTTTTLQCPPEKCDGLEYWKYVDYSTNAALVGGNIPFNYVLEQTPPGCILAPVSSMADLLEIQAAIPVIYTDAKANAWVGITKAASDVFADGTIVLRREDWVNLDGSKGKLVRLVVVSRKQASHAVRDIASSLLAAAACYYYFFVSPPVVAPPQYTTVPASADLWNGVEPNNSPPLQTKAHWYGSSGGKLRDVNADGNTGPKILAAVYKCCFDLCVEE